jgi:hypothetical protein
LIREALTLFDLDGLELDWMRFGYFFRVGRELEGGKILTDFIAQVRREAAKAARHWGHPIRLGARVPSTPETARQLGLDGAAWARAGLIDLLVVTPFWATCEFNMPISTWRRLLDGTNVMLAGGLEVLYRPMPGGKPIEMTPAQAVGASMAVLSGGADLVYLFNYFPESKPWPAEQFNSTLRAMAGCDSLGALARTHAITYRDVRAPGEPADNPLPATGSQCAFRLQTGSRPVGRKVEVIIELDAPNGGVTSPPAIRVNGVPCPVRARENTTFIYEVPETAQTEEVHVIEASADSGHTMRINRVEFTIAAIGT